MPSDVTQLVIGLALLLLLSAGFGMFSARLFMWATRGSGDSSKP
jgi:hypothetical protein